MGNIIVVLFHQQIIQLIILRNFQTFNFLLLIKMDRKILYSKICRVFSRMSIKSKKLISLFIIKFKLLLLVYRKRLNLIEAAGRKPQT
jgi:hypothetical protein